MTHFYIKRFIRKNWKLYLYLLIPLTISVVLLIFCSSWNDRMTKSMVKATNENRNFYTGECYIIYGGLTDSQMFQLHNEIDKPIYKEYETLAMVTEEGEYEYNLLLGIDKEDYEIFMLDESYDLEDGDIFFSWYHSYLKEYAPDGSILDFYLAGDGSRFVAELAIKDITTTRYSFVDADWLRSYAKEHNMKTLKSALIFSDDYASDYDEASMFFDKLYFAGDINPYCYPDFKTTDEIYVVDANDYMEEYRLYGLMAVFIMVTAGVVMIYSFWHLSHYQKRDYKLFVSLGISYKDLLRLVFIQKLMMLLVALVLGIIFSIPFTLLAEDVMQLIYQISELEFTFSAFLRAIVSAVILFLLTNWVDYKAVCSVYPLQIKDDEVEMKNYLFYESSMPAKMIKIPEVWIAAVRIYRRRKRQTMRILPQVIALFVPILLFSSSSLYTDSLSLYPKEEFRVEFVMLNNTQGITEEFDDQKLEMVPGVKSVTWDKDSSYLVDCDENKEDEVRVFLQEHPYQIRLIEDIATEKEEVLVDNKWFRGMSTLFAVMLLIIVIVQQISGQAYSYEKDKKELRLYSMQGGTDKMVHRIRLYETWMVNSITALIFVISTFLLSKWIFPRMEVIGGQQYYNYIYRYPWLEVVAIIVLMFVVGYITEYFITKEEQKCQL